MSHPVTTTIPCRSSIWSSAAFPASSRGWSSILLFFPIFWMTITAFKTEQQAYASSLIFHADARQLP